MVYYNRFMQMGILVAVEQENNDVIFGFNVQRTGLDLGKEDIEHMCNALAESLNRDTTQYNGKFFAGAIATQNRVVLKAY